jgi:hypothetical protein
MNYKSEWPIGVMQIQPRTPTPPPQTTLSGTQKSVAIAIASLWYLCPVFIGCVLGWQCLNALWHWLPLENIVGFIVAIAFWAWPVISMIFVVWLIRHAIMGLARDIHKDIISTNSTSSPRQH